MEKTIGDSLRESFQDLGAQVIAFIPELVIAILIVVAGWLLGGFLKGIVKTLFKKLKLTSALDKAGVDTLSERAGYAFKPAEFVGSLVEWFVIIVFIVVALDVLQLNDVTSFFTVEILTYIPRVIVAALILLGAMVLANLVATSVAGAARAANFGSADMIARFSKYAILVFAGLAALNQLQIATELVQLLFAGLVFGTSLAFGLAFGLGGRETAARYLERMTRR